MDAKKNIAVIIRVFSRIDDALALIHVIRQNWITHNYTLFVSYNGRGNGHIFPDGSLNGVQLIEFSSNSGHRTGAQDLLLASFDYIDEQFDYAIFTEADVWVLDENLILEALASDCDIATTIWVESRQSMAVDFFVIKQTYLAKNKELFNWKSLSPETAFSNYLTQHQASIHIFNSMRPIHAPKMMQIVLSFLHIGKPYNTGRFNLLSKANVLTHHIEDLPNGIVKKKALANALIKTDLFLLPKKTSHIQLNFFEKYIQQIGKYFPQSAWLKKAYWKSLKDSSYFSAK